MLRRTFALLFILLLMASVAYADNGYSYNESTRVLLIGGYEFTIPEEFDCYRTDDTVTPGGMRSACRYGKGVENGAPSIRQIVHINMSYE